MAGLNWKTQRFGARWHSDSVHYHVKAVSKTTLFALYSGGFVSVKWHTRLILLLNGTEISIYFSL